MNGKLIHTLNTQTVIWASTGSARNSTLPSPSEFASIGSGLCGVATSQFHDAADTTTGTIQGSRRSTLNTPPAGILVRSSSARASPMIQLPNTPTIVKTTVNRVECQNASFESTLV